MTTKLKLPELRFCLRAGVLLCLVAVVIPGDIAAQDDADDSINSFRVTNESFQTGSFLPQLQMPGPVQPVIPDPPVQPEHAGGEMQDQSVCTHVVQYGDTLAGIVKKYLGSSERWPELVRGNPGVNFDRLPAGAVINLPCAALSTPVVPPLPSGLPEPERISREF